MNDDEPVDYMKELEPVISAEESVQEHKQSKRDAWVVSTLIPNVGAVVGILLLLISNKSPEATNTNLVRDDDPTLEPSFIPALHPTTSPARCHITVLFPPPGEKKNVKPWPRIRPFQIRIKWS